MKTIIDMPCARTYTRSTYNVRNWETKKKKKRKQSACMHIQLMRYTSLVKVEHEASGSISTSSWKCDVRQDFAGILLQEDEYEKSWQRCPKCFPFPNIKCYSYLNTKRINFMTWYVNPYKRLSNNDNNIGSFYTQRTYYE